MDANGIQAKERSATPPAPNPPPKNSERTGWAINDKNHLQFDGNDLIACPNSIDGAWSIWASGVANPAGNKNCTGIAARVEETKNPNACKYTE